MKLSNSGETLGNQYTPAKLWNTRSKILAKVPKPTSVMKIESENKCVTNENKVVSVFHRHFTYGGS